MISKEEAQSDVGWAQLLDYPITVVKLWERVEAAEAVFKKGYINPERYVVWSEIVGIDYLD